MTTAGWTEPDERGQVTFVHLGPLTLDDRAPERAGYEPFFVAVHGADYTRWTYRPTEQVPA
jgi:hypothetical protein